MPQFRWYGIQEGDLADTTRDAELPPRIAYALGRAHGLVPVVIAWQRLGDVPGG